MNADIERDIDGEAGMRGLVETLRAAPQAHVAAGFSLRVMAAVRADSRRRRALGMALPLAACLAIGIAVGAVALRDGSGYSAARLAACQRSDGLFSESSAAPYVQAFAVAALSRDAENGEALRSAVEALVRGQNADGGWSIPSMSARNVAALREAARAGVTGAAAAYRRGQRYLRMNGMVEMSADELAREASAAMGRVGGADGGIVCSVALCAGSAERAGGI